MKANILTIGTEITSGEIINSNAAWIAQRLEEKGYYVTQALSVPDEDKLVLSAMKYLKGAEVTVVAGGLGPTSDDRTRELVARWVGRPLIFSKKVWCELQALYQERSLPLRQAHRHQCYFPKGAKILRNPVGTAQGFSFKNGACQIFVLPGPPRELEAMWSLEITPKLRRGKALAWRHWTCLGMPESEVAEKIEPLIEGLAIEVGYRASVPYVHLKLRGHKLSHAIINQVEDRLGKNVVGKDKHDFAEDFVQSLEGRPVIFQDQITRGLLVSRLAPLVCQLANAKIRFEDCWNQPLSENYADYVYGQLLAVDGSLQDFEAVWKSPNGERRWQFRLPFRQTINSERGAKAAVELALHAWWTWRQEGGK